MPVDVILTPNRIAKITFENGYLNIINHKLIEELRKGIKQVLKGKPKVLVIQGKGSVFSAGVDIREHLPDKIPQTLRAFHKMLIEIMSLEFLTVSVVKGYAFGGGLELMIATDLCIADKKAIFGCPEITLAAYPPFASVLLPTLTGFRHTNELVFTGKRLSAKEAKNLGLVNQVEGKDIEKKVNQFINMLASRSLPAIKSAKRAIYGSRLAEIKRWLSWSEKIYLKTLMKFKDPVEGVNAFIEKRPPKWTDS